MNIYLILLLYVTIYEFLSTNKSLIIVIKNLLNIIKYTTVKWLIEKLRLTQTANYSSEFAFSSDAELAIYTTTTRRLRCLRPTWSIVVWVGISNAI